MQDFAKNAIVERYNRTLRRIMEVDKAKREPRPFTEADIARYVKNYNNDLHSTIKARPIDVYEYKSTRRHNLFDKTRGDYIERGKYWRMKTT